MSVYDANGNAVYTCFDIDGNNADTLYDISGNPVYSRRPLGDPVGNLVAMTYNVQSWQPINYSWKLVNSIFAAHNPDVIGFQEYSSGKTLEGYSSGTTTDFIAEYTEHLEEGDTTGSGARLALASNYTLTDVETVRFDSVPSDRYQKAYINFGGKRIAVFNVHLTWDEDDATLRHAEAQELFEVLSNEEYFILIGDLNTTCESTEDESYIRTIKPFVEAGCSVANCTEERGFNYTHTDGTVGTHGQTKKDGTAAKWYAHDNIITSYNIKITNVIVDDAKLNYKTTGWANATVDHLPLVAHLTVYDYSE